MSIPITARDRQILRELAKLQLEYARLPIMEQRRKQWFDVNKGKADALTPVVIESWTFDGDMMPPGVLTCETDAARAIESVLRRNIREHELIDDDKVIPDTFPVGWHVRIDEFGFPIESTHATDSQGRSVGYVFKHAITDLERDFSILKPVTLSLDRAASLERHDFVRDLLGDILRVEIDSRPPSFGLTQKVIRLMGMERYFMAMYDQPEAVHRLMRYLTQNQLSMMKFYEDNGLLTVNNGNQHNGPTSYSFTDELPSPGYSGVARLRDIWLWAESQETVGISPQMFAEFVTPYYAQACEPLGMVYYGCCEPVHPFWTDLKARIPQIRKVSISRWCDEEYMGAQLAGTNVVYSRKPDPTYLGVGSVLDEDGWRAHMRKTLTAARDCASEIVIRDVYEIKPLSKARRAIDIAREEARRILGA